MRRLSWSCLLLLAFMRPGHARAEPSDADLEALSRVRLEELTAIGRTLLDRAADRAYAATGSVAVFGGGSSTPGTRWGGLAEVHLEGRRGPFAVGLLYGLSLDARGARAGSDTFVAHWLAPSFSVRLRPARRMILELGLAVGPVLATNGLAGRPDHSVQARAITTLGALGLFDYLVRLELGADDVDGFCAGFLLGVRGHS